MLLEHKTGILDKTVGDELMGTFFSHLKILVMFVY